MNDIKKSLSLGFSIPFATSALLVGFSESVNAMGFTNGDFTALSGSAFIIGASDRNPPAGIGTEDFAEAYWCSGSGGSVFAAPFGGGAGATKDFTNPPVANQATAEPCADLGSYAQSVTSNSSTGGFEDLNIGNTLASPLLARIRSFLSEPGTLGDGTPTIPSPGVEPMQWIGITANNGTTYSFNLDRRTLVTTPAGPGFTLTFLGDVTKSDGVATYNSQVEYVFTTQFLGFEGLNGDGTTLVSGDATSYSLDIRAIPNVSVPESSSMLGILGIGTFMAVSSLKRKKKS